MRSGAERDPGAASAGSPRHPRHSRSGRPRGRIDRILRVAMLGITLAFVVIALAVSLGLVVYTGWQHQIREGVFALIFAVLSAQIALNWLLWREEISPHDPA